MVRLDERVSEVFKAALDEEWEGEGEARSSPRFRDYLGTWVRSFLISEPRPGAISPGYYSAGRSRVAVSATFDSCTQ